jgi:hypothetical protein
MKIEINITKGKFWALLVLGILSLGILALAVVPDTPNPGHDASEIAGLTAESFDNFEDDVLNLLRDKVTTTDKNIASGSDNYETHSLECEDEDQRAISCSATITGNSPAPDFWYCELEENSCKFMWDETSARDDGAMLHCNCI